MKWPSATASGNCSLVGKEEVCVEVFVPGEQQRVGADRDERRRHQRQVDQAEELQRRRAVDLRRLVQLVGQLVGGLLQHPDRIGRSERHHREHQRPAVVQQAVHAHRLVHRDREERRRDEVGEEREVHHRAPASDFQPADGERRAGRHRERDHAHRDRDPQRVPDLHPEVVQVEMVLLRDRLEVAQGRLVRPQRAGERRVLRRDREQEDVVDRDQRPQQDRDRHQDEDPLFVELLHSRERCFIMK